MLTDPLTQINTGGDYVVGSCNRRHDLNQLHHLSWVEEVQSDDIGRSTRHRCELDHRQTGGGCGQDCAGLADLVKVFEQHCLDGDLFNDGFENEIAIGEIIKLRRSRYAGERSGLIFLRRLTALYGLVE